jgi:hypothetical protein
MIHEWCDKCNRRGSSDCSCACTSCAGKGNVQEACRVCDGRGNISCSLCSGSGRVLVSKSWLRGEKYGNCSRCGGSRQLECKECKSGSVKTSCSSCHGSGGKTDCPICGGSKKISCASCGGKGKLRPRWSKERIREEIAERRARIRENEAIILEQEKAGIDYPGEYQYKGIEYLQEEIRELMSWL